MPRLAFPLDWVLVVKLVNSWLPSKSPSYRTSVPACSSRIFWDWRPGMAGFRLASHKTPLPLIFNI